MADPREPVPPLSPAEEALDATELRRIEDRLYRAVLRRVAVTLLVAGALTVGGIALIGWLSWSALRRRIVHDAVSTLQTDDSLRSDVLAGLGIDTTGYARLVEMLGQLEAGGTGAFATERDMAELQKMLESLLGEPAPGTQGPARRR